ncbi:unnamed protein product [Urochloa decumbens]|uniref:F-box domain-containing protein n=1 Tax=Urochloa decumbens TaxID=240449 RepID=A0ABC8YXJ1_9POAL
MRYIAIPVDVRSPSNLTRLLEADPDASSAGCSGATLSFIESLPSDVLGEIFLHLPSLASLASVAAASCKRWRAVAGSPDFLRGFHTAKGSPPVISYVTTFFTSYPVRDNGDLNNLHAFFGAHGAAGWIVCDCRHGLLLISQDGGAKVMAVCEPMSNIKIPIGRPAGDLYAFSYFVDRFLPAGDDDGRETFRVVSVQHDGDDWMRTAVYDHGAGAWAFRSWVAGIEAPTASQRGLYTTLMHGAGCVYWKYPRHGRLLSLDTATMELSVVPLPPGVSGKLPYAVGETKNAECCLVAVSPDPAVDGGQVLQVWHQRAGGGGAAQCWELGQQVPVLELAEVAPARHRVRCVRAVAAGVALLGLEGGGPTRSSGKHVALCLESLKVEAKFVAAGLIFLPYQMAWPPVLAIDKN